MTKFKIGTVGEGDAKDGCLLLVRGLPGSGKSTWARNLLKHIPGGIHLEADMYFETDEAYHWEGDKLAAAHRWCLNSAKIFLAQGKIVLVSNCNLKFSEADDYIRHCKRIGKPVDVTTLEDYYGSVHNVPEERMRRLRQRMEDHDTFMEKVKSAYCTV